MKNSKFFIFALSVNLASGTVFADNLFPLGANNKKTVCNGRAPRFTPKATVVFRYPNTKGLPIDQAAQLKSDRLKTVRILLKKGYFSQYYFNADLEQVDGYWESIGKDHHDLESITKDRQHMWSQGKYSTLGRDPMDPTLAKLRETYTMRIPIKTLKDVFQMKDESRWTHMGYDFYTFAWKPSFALADAGTIWENYLYRMTTVTETAKESGETVFEVKLDLSLFCQTAVAMDDLISK